MGKLFLGIVLVVGLALLNPDIRARARPHVQFLIDPVASWTVNRRIGEITRKLEADPEKERIVGADAVFVDFLKKSFFGADAHLDAWGNPYALRRERFQVRVVSAGPDGVLGTADNITGRPIGTGLPR